MSYKILKTEKLPQSEVQIEAEITAEELDSFWPRAVRHLNEHTQLDGFRPGKIPENILISKVGEMAILEEAAELALAHYYPIIIVEEKIKAIGRPKITITKMAKGNPMSFKIVTAVAPDIKLPNYKKIAKEIMSVEESTDISEKEYEDLVENIRKSRAPHVHKEGEEHKDDEKLELPEFSDEFVKSLGDFSDVADFEKKVKESMKLEKQYRAKEKKRIEILEKLGTETTVEIPEILIESELNKMQSQFEENLKAMNITLEDYAKKIEKSLEDVRKEWRTEAEKRAKVQLVINEIALEEKLEPSKEDVEKETKHLLEHYKDISPERVQTYVEFTLTNDKVLQFLEDQK